jgi:translation elongation factor P/translation initiation factor 5A
MGRTIASKLKRGNYFINPEDNEPYMCQTNDHSKSGKHGHAKSRIGCVGLFSQKKKTLLFTADESLDVPEILKKTGQITDVDLNGKIVHVMDVEDYNTYEVAFPLDEEDVDTLGKLQRIAENPDLAGDSQIEYWDVLNKKFVTRVSINK